MSFFSTNVVLRLQVTVRRLCEVAVNRSRKFRFRRHVAKANFYLLNYEKKLIKLAFCGIRSTDFQLAVNSAILQNRMLAVRAFSYRNRCKISVYYVACFAFYGFYLRVQTNRFEWRCINKLFYLFVVIKSKTELCKR